MIRDVFRIAYFVLRISYLLLRNTHYAIRILDGGKGTYRSIKILDEAENDLT